MMSKIPNILHLYWGLARPLSWLRYMTVQSFATLNPEWQIMVWQPRERGASPQWKTGEHDSETYSGRDWLPAVREISPEVQIREADLKGYPLLAEVHRSDLWRWQIMTEIGGWWSDFDILYFRPMTALMPMLDPGAEVLLCPGQVPDLKDWQSIGFLAGAKSNALFAEMLRLGLELARAPYLSYQDLGENLLKRFAGIGDTVSCGTQIRKIPQTAVYPFRDVRGQYRALWRDGPKAMDLQPYTVGVHWFGGQSRNAAQESRIEDERVLKAQGGGVAWAYRQLMGTEEPKNDPSTAIPAIKYSIIMPYIARAAQLWNTLISYQHHYGARQDWEVVIVQDVKCGARDQEAFREIVATFKKRGLRMRVITAGSPDQFNPGPHFNAAARMATGEFFVLTSPEVFHICDILSGLDDAFDEDICDPYVICACQDREGQWRQRIEHIKELRGHRTFWFQHSQYRPTNYHFCSSLSRANWERIGGFDEAYADGYCFDDDDFRERVRAAGIPFVLRDDLLTYHLQHNNAAPQERAKYMALWNRNKEFYESKWGPYRHIPSPRID